LSFDFSDEPQLVELLRIEAAKTNKTQKAIVIESLKAYFSDKLENALVYRAADNAFSEWDNDSDSIYDTL
jgi:hypothetical protein